MATQKPISTISYNSESFLREKLDAWLQAHIIQAYQYICHKGEDGDKDHIHVRIEPNKRVDPMDLTEELREYQIGKEKPLGVRPWRPSKEEDWILYAVHDADYLRLKYENGDKGEKLPYECSDIRAPEGYDVETAYIRARSHLRHTGASMAARLSRGEKPAALVMSGENPYMVNAVLRTMAASDYQRLAADYNSLMAQYDLIMDAIARAGLDVLYDEYGAPYIVGGQPSGSSIPPERGASHGGRTDGRTHARG